MVAPAPPPASSSLTDAAVAAAASCALGSQLAAAAAAAGAEAPRLLRPAPSLLRPPPDDARARGAAGAPLVPMAAPAERGRAPVQARGGKGAMGRSVVGSISPVDGGMPGPLGGAGAVVGLFFPPLGGAPPLSASCWAMRRASVAWSV